MTTIETDAPPDAPEEELETCDNCRQTSHSCECERCYSCEEPRYPDRLCRNCHECRDCCECSYCESCERRHYADDMCGECDYCTGCCDCSSDSDLIHDYSYTPSELEFVSLSDSGNLVRQYSSGRAPDGATYLGLEIETEAVHGSPHEIAEVWSEYSPFGYAKHDGSLSDGVECVTHPYTYQALRHADLASTLGRMAKTGARAWGTGTCGLHIHVSRRTFAHRSHMWRFVRALDSFQSELIRLAGRNDSQWASWETDEGLAYGKGRATKIVAGKASNGTRYRAINMENRHTIELRFWRGSLAPHAVYGAAAITDALVQWTRDMPFRQVREGLYFTDFMSWVEENLSDTQYQDIYTLALKRNMPRRADRNDIEDAA